MITSISACDCCKAEIHPDDNFCQDCGAGIVTGDSEKERGLALPDAVLTCLKCGCQFSEPSSYCSSCGSLMSDVGVYTTTVKALPQVDLKTIEPVPAAELAQPLSAKGIQLTSPLLRRNGRTEKPQSKLVYKTPSLIHAIVDLSPGILVLAFFALVVVWFMDFDRERSQVSLQAVYAQAQSAAASDRFDQSIEILDKLSVSRSGNLTGEERALLNDMLYKRALVYAGKGDNKNAIFDLLRVTPDYAQYSDARTKLQECGVQAQANSPTADEAGQAPQKATEKTVVAGDVGSSDAKKADNRLVAVSQKSISQAAVAPAINEQAGGSGTLNADLNPERQAQPVTNANHPAEAASRQPGGGVAGAVARDNLKYTDADVARYNKLLADYFSSPRSEHQEAGKRGEGGVPDTGGPPTLREWLEQGKPNF